MLGEKAAAIMVENATLIGRFEASDGWVDQYIDMVRVFQQAPLAWAMYYKRRVRGLWPIGCGRSGAYIIGMLGRGTVWNAGKTYGIPFSGMLPAQGPGGAVALVDDICVTGTTMARMHEVMDGAGLVVVREVVAWPWQDVDEVVAKRLKEI